MDPNSQQNDLNQNNFQGGQSNVPPPPPSAEDQVAVRTMASDLESIKQTGGDSPESQIISAPEVSTARMENMPVGQNYQSTNQNFQTNSVPPSESQPNVVNQDFQNQPAIDQTPLKPASSFNFKTILLIIGIVIVAGGIGFGVYYFVTSLRKQPEVSVPTNQVNLPTATIQPTSTPVVNTPTPTPVAPLIHSSIIYNPTKTETLTLSNSQLVGIKEAIAKASVEKLISGNVKDLAFIDTLGQPVESSVFVASMFPAIAPNLSNFLDKDFTSWLYGDKTGGNKFGAIFQIKPNFTLDQVKTSISSAIESSPVDMANLFVSPVTMPTTVEFKEGQIESVPVKFLVFNAKTGNVFEYGFYSLGTTNYLVMSTSYNQMLSIIKNLKSKPAINPLPITQSPSPTASSTNN